jgi:hypothetical protein
MKIVQQDIDTFNIGIVIDENLKNKPPSIQEIVHVFKDGFQNKFGSDITISVSEIQNVSRDEPRIISQVDPKTLNITGYA